ncbi:hypothetical protein KSP40_PGU013792 [Platanthera guangdongensis]|uniref:Glutaredoxin n=1 Tax=Platanthera guangdongensis TaxID=2320717 RepID=A0ABR2MH23_9ASPA
MDAAYRRELQGLICEKVQPVALPQVFVRGRHIGGAEEVRHLHESGELGNLLEGILPHLPPSRPRRPPAVIVFILVSANYYFNRF